MSAQVIDLTGQRFGMLTVVSRDGTTKHRTVTWLCRCDCGGETIVAGNDLKRNHTKSCGCLRQGLAKHRKTDTRLFNVWKSMKRRCNGKTDKNYDRYGGRGITVCEEWQHNFQAFYDWSMANGYDENAPRGKCTIDRIDNDKGYLPENCRWVDMKVQTRNRAKWKHTKKRKDN